MPLLQYLRLGRGVDNQALPLLFLHQRVLRVPNRSAFY